jgi:hypothetical protein
MQPSGSRRSPSPSFSTAGLDGLAGRAKNIGSKTLRFLDIFKSSYYGDLSLNQWLALTPPDLLKAHLNLDKQVTDALRKTKAPIVPAWRSVAQPQSARRRCGLRSDGKPL